jgi:antitoxin component YwqK of YwqJK toxin-antitoxin module
MAQRGKHIFLVILLSFFSFDNLFAQYDTIYNENNELFGIGKLLNSQKIGVWRFYQDNKIKFLIELDSNGVQNGKFFEFVDGDSTQIFLESNYVNGKLDGESIMYFTYPQVQRKRNYKKGLLHGVSYYFYENGKIADIVNYKEGQYWGDYRKYYPNGILGIEGTYEKDNRIGIWNEYHENGKKSASGRYVYGFRVEMEKFDAAGGGWGMEEMKRYDKDGEWELYDIDGNLYKIETYKNGVLVGTRRVRK